jgi:signal transduction histidine kinase
MLNLDAAHPSHQTAHRIVEIASRGKNLTHQLLDFGRKRSAPTGTVELDAAVHGCAELLQTLVGPSVRLTIRCNSKGRRVAAEPGDIDQVLMNLATNARDAMPSGGALLVSTDLLPESQQIRVRVRDSGSGMDEATMHRIFDPFFTTKPPGAGTGLGLSTSRATIQRLGGDISVDSARRLGTTFTILLPARDA